MKNKKIGITFLVVLLIVIISITYLFPLSKSQATNGQDENVNMEEISSEEELKKISLLGGTTSAKAWENDQFLGLARDFSIFAQNDIIFTGSDTEGKVAAGGGVIANTETQKYINGRLTTIPSYQYQVATKKTDNDSADIIVGKGPVKNIALDFGYTDDGLTRTENESDNRIIAYASNAESMNLDDYTDEEKEHFVEADLIDFEQEFYKLNMISQSLGHRPPVGYQMSGRYSIYGNVGSKLAEATTKTKGTKNVGFYENLTSQHELIVFKGYDTNLNIFYYSGDISGKGIAFDVPYGSKVVLNVISNNVKLDFGSKYSIYYPLSEEKLSEINTENQKIGYVRNVNESVAANSYLRDSTGNLKPFISVAGGIANEGNLDDISEKILINLPETTNLELYDCGVSVLAPNADVKTPHNANAGTPASYNGYFLGTLVCKSYEGHLQFGPIKKNITRVYNIKINKIDELTKNSIDGAKFELYDSENNKIYSWTSSSSNLEDIELKSGTYKIKEVSAPANYECENDEFVFTINPDGKVYNVDGEKIGVADITFINTTEEKTYTDHQAEWNKTNDAIDFPTTYQMLREGINSQIGNVNKLSFEIDSSEATQHTDRDLYMVVSENGVFENPNQFHPGGETGNWMEFIRYTKVENGQNITTTIPVVDDIYSDYHPVVSFKPHFYRQIIDAVSTDAIEVSDIKIKNVKAYWKEVQKELVEERTRYSLNNNELNTINLSNKHITTTIKIKDVDSETREALKGTVFEIYNKESNEVIFTTDETDENGNVVLEDLKLNKGIYYIKEKTVQDGYKLSDKTQEFEVTESDEKEFVFENEKIEEPKTNDEDLNRETKEENEAKQVQTGDKILILAAILATAVIVFVITLVIRKKQKNK